MMFSSYKKQRILYFFSKAYKAPTIVKLMRDEGLQCSRVGIAKFLKKFRETGTIKRRAGSGRPPKVTAEIKRLVEEQMRLDDETTAVQLHRLLQSKGHDISIKTILHCRSSLGWTFRGSAYCQHIREANRVKRLAWAREHLHDSFDEVIWSDESSIQMESHSRFYSRKRGEAPRPKQRYVLCDVQASL